MNNYIAYHVPYPPYWHHGCGCYHGCGCHFGCFCARCHYQPVPWTLAPVIAPVPAVEAKIDRLLVLAEAAEKERKRAAAVNKQKSHRW